MASYYGARRPSVLQAAISQQASELARKVVNAFVSMCAPYDTGVSLESMTVSPMVLQPTRLQACVYVFAR